jgi:hypothetical protein
VISRNNVKPIGLVLTAVLTSAILFAVQCTPERSLPNKIAVETVLSWLPVDTETVVVADLPKGSVLKARDFRQRNDQNPNTVLSLREITALFESSPLSFLRMQDGAFATLVGEHKLALAVEGSRHFRPPHGLGEMSFEGCEIAIFADSLGSPQSLLARYGKSRTRQEQIEGELVNVFEEKMEEDVWTILMALPEPNVLLIASDRGYLKEVLQRMKGAPQNLALPPSLAEWKYVNRHAPFWGVRHYDRSQADLDPTSPFRGSKSANTPDDRAIGLTFNFDPEKSRTATVTYLTSGKMDSRLLEMFRTRSLGEQNPEIKDLHLSVQQLGPGATTFSFQLSKADSVLYFFLILDGMLGHEVYL